MRENHTAETTVDREAAVQEEAQWLENREPEGLFVAIFRRNVELIRRHLEAGTHREPTYHIPPISWIAVAMDLDPHDPAREEILDLFREYAPEQFFTFFCEQKINER